MYAIIESCGRQYKVSEGVSDDKDVKVGTPYVKGCKVEGTVTNNGKGKKILVYRYKAKKNERRTQGHRQPYTKVEIKSIVIG